MNEIIAALHRMFAERPDGAMEMPPKPGIHPRRDAFIHAMPAWIPSLGAAGIKWISAYPDNPRRGLAQINGLLILNDPDTGIPIAVMDATLITAMRTGAATAIAARHLARRDSSTVGIMACGIQGRSNLEALACEFNIARVHAYDIDPEIAARYAREMSAALDIEVTAVATVDQAVRDMDIVVTAGPILREPQPAIAAGWLAPGALACTVDFDCAWQAPAIAEADKIATDDLAQMQYYRRKGYFRDTPDAYADLGEIVAGLKPGRESAHERIISMNLGLALEDMTVARRIYEVARDRGIGTELPL